MAKSFAQFLWDVKDHRSRKERPYSPYTWDDIAAACELPPTTLYTWKSLKAERRPSKMAQYIQLEKFFGSGVWYYAADGDEDLAALLANRNRPEIRREIEAIRREARDRQPDPTYSVERST